MRFGGNRGAGGAVASGRRLFGSQIGVNNVVVCFDVLGDQVFFLAPKKEKKK